MINVDRPLKVENLETLVEALDEEQLSEYHHNGFVDTNEQAILDEFTYRQLQSKQYGYAVSNGT